MKTRSEIKLPVQHIAIAIGVALAIMATPTFAQAQEASDSEDEEKKIEVEVIEITAERRTESIQEVPVAVTAFSEAGIEQLRIEDFQDLTFKIPGFSINSFSKSRINPALRGGSSSLASAGAEQAVGLFIDDVYFGGSGDFELDLFDVERIEVLRGPQGTLFGRNTTGGLVNVVTKSHTGDKQGKFQLQVGNFGLNRVGGYIAAPVAENLYGSLAFTATNREGTSFNSVTGNDVDNLNRSAIRGKLIWEAAEDLELTFAIGHNRTDETGVARDAVSPQNTVDLDVLAEQNFVIDDDPRTVQMFDDGRFVSEQWVASLHVTKNFNDMIFQSITTARLFDSDQDPVSLTGVPTPLFALADSREVDAYTQEFRLLSAYADSALSWQTGVYLFTSEETRNLEAITRWDESVAGGAFSAIFGCADQLFSDFENFVVTPICIDNQPELFDQNEFAINENVETNSYSVYAEGTYEVSEELSFTLGGRYTYDEKELNGYTSGEYDWFWNPTPGRVVAGVKEDWGEFTWRAVVDYKLTDEILLYSSAATGFRSGTFDMAQSDPDLVDQAVDPETVTSYEVGFKSRLFDNRVQFNVALFDATYEDLQFFVNSIGSGGAATTTNAGEASVQGIEVDAAWAISKEFTLTFGYSHQNGDSRDIPAEAEIPEGTPPQGTVPNTYTAALNYTTDYKGKGEIYANIDFLKKDEYSLEFIDNSIPQFLSEVEGQVNANIGYRSDNGWAIQAWVQNLTDEDVVLYGQDFWFSLYGSSLATNPALTTEASFGPRYAEPRTFGLTVSYEFY